MKPMFARALIMSVLLAAGPALADKPDWAGGGKNKKQEKHQGAQAATSMRFTEQHRRVIAEYYGGQTQPGRKCPPGLAKKNNGCMPPGQAKKWGMGRPLPGDLRYYDLPRDLLTRLPPAPAGYRYVRVAADILLIAVGSSMVIDAVEDLVR